MYLSCTKHTKAIKKIVKFEIQSSYLIKIFVVYLKKDIYVFKVLVIQLS